LDSGPGITSFGRSHGLLVMEELGLMCDNRLLGLVPQ